MKKNIISTAYKSGVPKQVIVYEYPIRSKDDLVGNKRYKELNVFVNQKALPLQVGKELEITLSSDSNYAGGAMSLVITNQTDLDNGIAIIGHSEEAGTEFYLVIKDRLVN